MKVLSVKIKRFDKELPLPTRHSKGAACYDLCARMDTIIEAESFGYIPYSLLNFEEIENLGDENRGAFGSTGH